MARTLASMTIEELDQAIATYRDEVERLRTQGIELDMARGKPSRAQTDLSRPMLDVLNSESDLIDDGVDAGNYGEPDGLPSARRLMASLVGADPANTIVSGSSSLNLEFDVLAHAWINGIQGNTPWGKLDEVAFLCPSPGYDRHFAMTDHFGITNIAVPLHPDGPDMDVVEELVKDPKVKGMWCVPKYQNPTGITFSDEVVRRIAKLQPAAPDFRIWWDNAYVMHDIYDEGDELLEIFSTIEREGGRDLVYEFASTSKITFPGSGIACVCASAADMADLKLTFSLQRVCADKMNMLRHARYLPDREAVVEHMKVLATVMRPKFELVGERLRAGLGELGCCEWTDPRGGYFVTFFGPEGSAKAIVGLCREVGVVLTSAGATWPYGDDPRDRDIRIAPSFPTLEELGAALDVFCACARLVCAQLERGKRG